MISPPEQALALVGEAFGDVFLLERIEAGLGAMAANSIAGMVSDVKHYRRWARKLGIAAFPLDEQVLGRYLKGLERSGKRPTTAERRLASLARFVRLVGEKNQLIELRSDYVRDCLKGFKKRQGTRQRKMVPVRFGKPGDPLGGEGVNLLGLLASCGSDLRGVRNAALLAALYGGGLRVSEAIGLRVGDFAKADGAAGGLFLRSSKTDQLGEGVVVPLDPGMASYVARWVSEAGIGHVRNAPLFRRVFARRAPSTRPKIPARFDGRRLGDFVRDVRKAQALAEIEKEAPLQLAPGTKQMTRQGVIEIVRRIVGDAIDGGYVDIGSAERNKVIAAIGTHSFRVGLTHDLLANNMDLGRVMVAQRWTSASTAIGYARDLGAESSAVVELFERLKLIA